LGISSEKFYKTIKKKNFEPYNIELTNFYNSGLHNHVHHE
jgi:hypothetical protein